MSDINNLPWFLLQTAVSKLAELGEEEDVHQDTLKFIGALICNAGALRAGESDNGLDSFSNERRTIRTPEGTIVVSCFGKKYEIAARHAAAVERGWLDADAMWGAYAWGKALECYRW